LNSARSKLLCHVTVMLLMLWATAPAYADAELSQAAEAQSVAASTAEAANSTLSAIDWVVVALYMVGMLAVGWYCSRRTEDTDDYLLGGRKMNPSAVGISLFATLLSAISYLALPGEMIAHGPIVLWGIASIPFVFVIVGYFMIPHFMKLPVTSAYEILETKLGFKVRLLGSIIFLLIRFVWMALLIYMCADKVIVVVLGWSSDATPWVCAVIGFITITYTTIGGIRAVVITDVLQSFILFAGAILTVALITIRMGGFGWWPTEWAPHWAEQKLFSLDPATRLTILGAAIYEFCWWLCTAGSDQLAIQRYLATRDAKMARRSFLIASVANILVRGFLAVVGLALLGYYMHYKASAAQGAGVVADADQLFTRFIADALPVGAAGLVISGLLAAAMSSLSAGVNSVCAVITADIIDPIRGRTSNEKRHVKTARSVAFTVGLIVVLASTQMGRVGGNLLTVTFKTCNLFVAPLFGLFFMAMFVPFATPFGATFGALYGLVAAALLGYWDALTGQEEIGIQWYVPISLCVTILAGYFWCMIPTRGKSWLTLLFWSIVAAVPLVLGSLLLVTSFRIEG